MKRVEVRTQVEFEAALKLPDTILDLIVGAYALVTRGTESPWLTVAAGVGLNVEAWESSQPRVEAWGSSQPRVVASGYVQLSLLGIVVAKVTAKVAVLILGKAQVEGGHQTRIEINTPQDWCDYYGITVEDGVAVLYKALDGEMRSPKGFLYQPGSTPAADDWDGDARECGGGLHFSPTPTMAMEFHADAKRFAACPRGAVRHAIAEGHGRLSAKDQSASNLQAALGG